MPRKERFTYEKRFALLFLATLGGVASSVGASSAVEYFQGLGQGSNPPPIEPWIPGQVSASNSSNVIRSAGITGPGAQGQAVSFANSALNHNVSYSSDGVLTFNVTLPGRTSGQRYQIAGLEPVPGSPDTFRVNSSYQNPEFQRLYPDSHEFLQTVLSIEGINSDGSDINIHSIRNALRDYGGRLSEIVTSVPSGFTSSMPRQEGPVVLGDNSVVTGINDAVGIVATGSGARIGSVASGGSLEIYNSNTSRFVPNGRRLISEIGSLVTTTRVGNYSNLLNVAHTSPTLIAPEARDQGSSADITMSGYYQGSSAFGIPPYGSGRLLHGTLQRESQLPSLLYKTPTFGYSSISIDTLTGLADITLNSGQSMVFQWTHGPIVGTNFSLQAPPAPAGAEPITWKIVSQSDAHPHDIAGRNAASIFDSTPGTIVTDLATFDMAASGFNNDGYFLVGRVESTGAVLSLNTGLGMGLELARVTQIEIDRTTQTTTPTTSATSSATSSQTTTEETTGTTTVTTTVTRTNPTTGTTTETTTETSTESTSPTSTVTTTRTTSVTSSATSSPTTTASTSVTVTDTSSPTTTITATETSSVTSSATTSPVTTQTSIVTSTDTSTGTTTEETTVTTSPSTSASTSPTSSATSSASTSGTVTQTSSPSTSQTSTPTTTTVTRTTTPTSSVTTTRTTSGTTTVTETVESTPTSTVTSSVTQTPTSTATSTATSSVSSTGTITATTTETSTVPTSPTTTESTSFTTTQTSSPGTTPTTTETSTQATTKTTSPTTSETTAETSTVTSTGTSTPVTTRTSSFTSTVSTSPTTSQSTTDSTTVTSTGTSSPTTTHSTTVTETDTSTGTSTATSTPTVTATSSATFTATSSQTSTATSTPTTTGTTTVIEHNEVPQNPGGERDGDNDNTGIIIGAVLGAVALAALGLAALAYKRRRNGDRVRGFAVDNPVYDGLGDDLRSREGALANDAYDNTAAADPHHYMEVDPDIVGVGVANNIYDEAGPVPEVDEPVYDIVGPAAQGSWVSGPETRRRTATTSHQPEEGRVKETSFIVDGDDDMISPSRAAPAKPLLERGDRRHVPDTVGGAAAAAPPPTDQTRPRTTLPPGVTKALSDIENAVRETKL